LAISRTPAPHIAHVVHAAALLVHRKLDEARVAMQAGKKADPKMQKIVLQPVEDSRPILHKKLLNGATAA
jgi:hypothetical protein